MIMIHKDKDDEDLKRFRAQLQQDLDNLEKEFENELSTLKATPLDQEPTTVEIYIKTPQFYERLFKVRPIGLDEFALWAAPVYASCKYQAYKYFWSRGFYLTGGAKFGGDFLVYPGEPSRFHSQFILVCAESATDVAALTLKQLITYARMATSVKKTFILACLFDRQLHASKRLFTVDVNEKFQLRLISINWAHI